MVYAALLRGINVGGNNKIDMKLLKETFERTGMEAVVTYINSGNVMFMDEKHSKEALQIILQKAIHEDYKLDIKVLIRSINDYTDMMKLLPEDWKNDTDMKSDVLFLSEETNKDTLSNELNAKPQIDTVIYAPGAVLWSVDRKNVTKSGLQKLIGTNLYKNMTVRNVNTTRKIYDIMKKLQEN